MTKIKNKRCLTRRDILQYDKNYKLVYDTFVDIYAFCLDKGIPVSRDITLAKKLSSARSFYALTKQLPVEVDEPDKFEIIVSSQLFKSFGRRKKVALRNIMMHEFIHTIDGCFNHGNEWKKWASLLNDKHGYLINVSPYSTSNDFF